MTKVISSDLVSANSSSMITTLTELESSSTTLMSNIEAFITGSVEQLKGNGYDAVRSKLSFYVDALKKQTTICNNLKSNIKAANTMLLNFMEGYAMLDDDKIPEIERSIAYIKSLLASLQTANNPTVTASQVASWKEMLYEFEKLLRKLKELAPTDSSAFGIVGSVKNDVISYGNALLGIKLPNFDGSFKESYNTALAEKLSALGNVGTTTNSSGSTYIARSNNGVVVYNQRGYYDTKGQWHTWSYKNNGWGKSIKYSGCGPTALASCLATMLGNYKITPATIASKMTSSTANDGGKFMSICRQYGVNYTMDYNYSKKVSDGSNARDNLLKRGGTMIIASNMYNTWGGHYVAIVGMDSKGKYIVADPNSKKPGQALHLTQKELDRYTGGHTMTIYIAPKGMTVDQAISPVKNTTKV